MTIIPNTGQGCALPFTGGGGQARIPYPGG